ncbi:MAG: hypothetical protein REH83_04545, partial [Rickettsiella sp.]|nr:hypothetical protein [Rickettsiella sp.]
YYTVYHELLAIFLRKKQNQCICLLHDVLPPCGNRDLYYNPDSIPKAFLHPHSHTLALDSNFENSEYGFRSCGKFAWAIESGNPKNGVTEAIKDFLTAYKTKLDLHYYTVPLFYGLGILYSKKIINPSLQTLLSKQTIYRLLANETLFRHIENNRMKLYINLISNQELIKAKKKEIETMKNTKNLFNKKILKKIVSILSKKKIL